MNKSVNILNLKKAVVCISIEGGVLMSSPSANNVPKKEQYGLTFSISLVWRYCRSSDFGHCYLDIIGLTFIVVGIFDYSGAMYTTHGLIHTYTMRTTAVLSTTTGLMHVARIT